MPEEQMIAVENPEYAARLKYEEYRRVADTAIQQQVYKDQCKYQWRLTAIEVAQKDGSRGGNDLLEFAEEIYQWLIKDFQ